MKPYKITQQIHLYSDHNFVRVDDRVLLLSDIKKHMLNFHEKLCNKFKQPSRTYVDKDGRVHIFIAWDSVLSVAYDRFILQSLFQHGK